MVCADDVPAPGRSDSVADPDAVDALVAQVVAPDTGAYATSKVAINGLSTILAGELGPKKIRVNVVAPGIIDTSRLDDVSRGQVWDDMVATFILLGRAGTGEDVANMVIFLCSA